MTGTKIDLFREHRDEYAMTKVPALVNVRAGRYLTVSGTGTPQDTQFHSNLGALYGCAYTIKFAQKAKGRDFKVGVLEGLWWTGGGASSFDTPKAKWRWKLLIRVPSFVTRRDVNAALASLREKRGEVADVTLETIREGRAVQMLHVGAYGDERRTLSAMDELVREKHLRYRGAHHEIYLSDPRRVPPSRLRTILRHPVAAA